jgi:hypothetical protein
VDSKKLSQPIIRHCHIASRLQLCDYLSVVFCLAAPGKSVNLDAHCMHIAQCSPTVCVIGIRHGAKNVQSANNSFFLLSQKWNRSHCYGLSDPEDVEVHTDFARNWTLCFQHDSTIIVSLFHVFVIVFTSTLYTVCRVQISVTLETPSHEESGKIT